jgi:hypothetical protein
MTLRKLVGLAAIGGLLYTHKKRGGQMTLESFKDTARSLIDEMKAKADDFRAQAERKLNEQRGEGGFREMADDITGYGSSGYDYRSTERH